MARDRDDVADNSPMLILWVTGIVIVATSSPDAMRQYLSRENIAILEEEIEAFKTRLAHWTNAGAARQ